MDDCEEDALRNGLFPESSVAEVPKEVVALEALKDVVTLEVFAEVFAEVLRE